MPKARKITSAAKPAATVAPVASTALVALPVPAVVADKSADKLATRETRNADYLASATYPAEKLSVADRAYLATFAASAKANAGTINLAALDLIDRAARRLVNNRARAHRLAQFGFIVRSGDIAATSRFSFPDSITSDTAPAKASPNLLAVRSIYSNAKPLAS